ncbi:hypothetical protein [Longispora albida]|uniref:hypothetical protein n=1 Tax=Longispora albida TaxID=203523 RepID=UPI00035C96A0|nr:hypothetical protein [Longispora albida]
MLNEEADAQGVRTAAQTRARNAVQAGGHEDADDDGLSLRWAFILTVSAGAAVVTGLVTTLGLRDAVGPDVLLVAGFPSALAALFTTALALKKLIRRR